MINKKINFFSLTKEEILNFILKNNFKSFRASQLIKWIYKDQIIDFDLMSNLPLPMIEFLKTNLDLSLPEIKILNKSNDGTKKWLLDVGETNLIEMVFIPEKKRATLCISSQVGCALECTFCSTGKQGFNRNLSTEEIIGQLWLANNHLLLNNTFDINRISNVVFMGMGEPLSNYNNVVNSLEIMLDDHMYGLSRRRVTISTSGLIPAIKNLKNDCPVSLAVSLHAPNDSIRDELVPINRKYPIKKLIDACNDYIENAPRDFITFEYVMLNNVNDSINCAKELLHIAKVVPCKFNLIPFNPFPNSPYISSSKEKIKQFQEILIEAGFVATIRKTRGDDIDAACGQLAGKVIDKTKRTKLMSR